MTHVLLSASGVIALIISSFFFRFYRETRDRFFLLFSLGFATLAANWVILALVSPSAETRPYFYLPRLIAFAFIVAGIIDKNKNSRAG